jgi:hypothetical protein
LFESHVNEPDKGYWGVRFFVIFWLLAPVAARHDILGQLNGFAKVSNGMFGEAKEPLRLLLRPEAESALPPGEIAASGATRGMRHAGMQRPGVRRWRDITILIAGQPFADGRLTTAGLPWPRP